MKFRDREDEDLQINLTPLIDVVFLLLIFFMVSTTFSKESHLRIKLPEASSRTEAVQDQGIIEVLISAQGLISIKGPADEAARQLLSNKPADLRRALKQAGGGKTERVVVIRADRKTPHGSVIRVLDAARRQGYTHITFATQQSLEAEHP